MQVTGGRNGYGAKLANIFSTEFIIETCDGKSQYKQVHIHLYCLSISTHTINSHTSEMRLELSRMPCALSVHAAGSALLSA